MVSSTTPRFGPRCPPFLASWTINSWRISSANCFCCCNVSFLTCAGLSTMSRYRFIDLLVLQERSAGGLDHRLTSRVLVELTDLEFRLFELGLAGLDQPRAFFEFGQEGLQGQLPRFHRFNDGLQLLERLFKRQVFVGASLARAFRCVLHKRELRAKGDGSLAWSRDQS